MFALICTDMYRIYLAVPYVLQRKNEEHTWKKTCLNTVLCTGFHFPHAVCPGLACFNYLSQECGEEQGKLRMLRMLGSDATQG